MDRLLKPKDSTDGPNDLEASKPSSVLVKNLPELCCRTKINTLKQRWRESTSSIKQVEVDQKQKN